MGAYQIPVYPFAQERTLAWRCQSVAGLPLCFPIVASNMSVMLWALFLAKVCRVVKGKDVGPCPGPPIHPYSLEKAARPQCQSKGSSWEEEEEEGGTDRPIPFQTFVNSAREIWIWGAAWATAAPTTATLPSPGGRAHNPP